MPNGGTEVDLRCREGDAPAMAETGVAEKGGAGPLAA